MTAAEQFPREPQRTCDKPELSDKNSQRRQQTESDRIAIGRAEQHVQEKRCCTDKCNTKTRGDDLETEAHIARVKSGEMFA